MSASKKADAVVLVAVREAMVDGGSGLNSPVEQYCGLHKKKSQSGFP